MRSLRTSVTCNSYYQFSEWGIYTQFWIVGLASKHWLRISTCLFGFVLNFFVPKFAHIYLEIYLFLYLNFELHDFCIRNAFVTPFSDVHVHVCALKIVFTSNSPYSKVYIFMHISIFHFNAFFHTNICVWPRFSDLICKTIISRTWV